MHESYDPPDAELGRPSRFLGDFYSPGQVGAAAFFGGPPAATHQLAHNYGAGDRADLVLRCHALGWLAVASLIPISLLLPENFPSAPIPIAYSIALREFAKRSQGGMLGAAAEAGSQRVSNWRVAGLVVLYLVVSVALVFGAILMIPENWLSVAA